MGNFVRRVIPVLGLLCACSGGKIEFLVNPCARVQCAGELEQCDPADALCKCGPAALNLVCGPQEVCRAQGESAFACIDVRCELTSCSNGETCQPSSGECACGTGPDA